MTTFALVHGAFHGAWCWDLLRPRLESSGHRTVAMDLPCDDPEAGNARYAEFVLEAIRDSGADVIVVGHSLGGLTIPLVAAARPVARLVFLNAFIPIPGRPFSDQFDEEGIFPPTPESTWPVTDEDGLMTWPRERVIPALYPDCPADLANWASSLLRRQSRTPHLEVCPLLEWPRVPSSYILSREDLAVGQDWSRRAAQERLGVAAAELPGGHMSMLSHPDELAGHLDRIAKG
jgi:pimeloyl-ACP methyl ester carboxylesterase